jgi:competence protein ComGA
MDELFEDIIFEALKRHATDIHFKLQEKLTISLREYGQLMPFRTLDHDTGAKLMNYMKYRSFINVNYKMTPQTGSFHYVLNGHTYFLRVSFLPGMHFESIVIRILNNHDEISIKDLSEIKDFTDFLGEICKKKQGLFLVSGATGSGKSTTLYAVLDRIIEMGGRNIVTLEDPIEMIKEHCLQIEMHEELGIDYHSSLKQILRHDPDVIMIGEIRDAKTAKLAITCSLTGHLVLSTIHASTALLVIKRMLNLGVSDTDLEDVLVGIVSQRMKYDLKNKKVVVLPELLRKNQIKEFLHHEDVHYTTFKDNAQLLISEGMAPYMFEEELEEE